MDVSNLEFVVVFFKADAVEKNQNKYSKFDTSKWMNYQTFIDLCTYILKLVVYFHLHLCLYFSFLIQNFVMVSPASSLKVRLKFSFESKIEQKYFSISDLGL